MSTPAFILKFPLALMKLFAILLYEDLVPGKIQDILWVHSPFARCFDCGRKSERELYSIEDGIIFRDGDDISERIEHCEHCGSSETGPGAEHV
jgi:hypothetical protein